MMNMRLTIVVVATLFVQIVVATIFARLAGDNYSLLLAGILTLTALSAWLIRRLLAQTVTVTLANVVSGIHRMVDGDLTLEWREAGIGEFNILLNAMGLLRARFFSVVSVVRGGIQTMALSAREMADDNADLAKRTHAQSASLEATAVTLEQFTATVRQNADNADAARQHAVSSHQIALQGGDLVQRVSQTMGVIRHSSKRMEEHIAVIDSIAFQTNILALNAAVEAARAGASGAGFAVVATAVRALAHRSALAAREIRQLIMESVKRIEHASELTDQARSTMQTLMVSANQLAEIVKEISEASREQSAGIEVLGSSVATLELTAHQNATLVEQATKTASVLRARAGLLVGAMSDFRLGAREYGDMDEAQAMVEMGVSALNDHGLVEFIFQVNDFANRDFHDRDLYLQVLDASTGILIAHGSNPRLVGNDISVARDADGKPFARDMVRAARAKKMGWIDYRYPHPLSGDIREKRSYFMLAQGVVIACGAYKCTGVSAGATAVST